VSSLAASNREMRMTGPIPGRPTEARESTRVQDFGARCGAQPLRRQLPPCARKRVFGDAALRMCLSGVRPAADVPRSVAWRLCVRGPVSTRYDGWYASHPRDMRRRRILPWSLDAANCCRVASGAP